MECINLSQRFGSKYRVIYEESYYAELGSNARIDNPWLQILLARHGHIYPHGDELLAASTNKRGHVATELATLPCTTVVQDGDDGLNVVFHADEFAKVAALLKPRRRRQLSEKDRVRLSTLGRENLKRYREANVRA